MDIVKGSLDEISRPASISKSRSGSRASTASSSEKPKLNLVARSLEVLPPEPGLSKVSSSISENIWSSAESSFSSSCDEMDVSFKSSVSGSRREISPRQPTEGKETDRERRGTPSLQPTEGKETDCGRKGTPSLQPTEGKETDRGRRGTPSLQPTEGKETDRERRGTLSLQPTEGKETDRGRKGTPSLQPTEGKETDRGRKGTPSLQPTEGKETDRGRKGTPSLQPTEGKETDRGRKGTPSLQLTEGKETGHDRRGTPPLQPSENIVNYEDHTTASPNQHPEMRNTAKQTVNSKEASDAKPHEASDEENTDPELAGAIRKMKMLDKILAKKQVREKEVKYQGQQMRKKLWEELQSAISPEAPQTHEETLNTRKFLALTPQARDVTDADSLEEEVSFTPVFHTQIPAEDSDWPRAPNDLDSHHRNDLSDVSNDGDKISSDPRKRSRVKMNKRDFIKRNIELARDAGHPVVLMDDEKQRIEDLLKDDEEDGVHPEALVEVSRWIIPGEGYTPEPEEHKLLAKIDAELQAVLFAKEFASISSSCTSIETQCNQDCFSPMNGDEGAELFESAEDILPGELVLRLTKEERLQQARLRDIDHELEALGRSLNTPGAPSPGLSEQQLRALLSECWSPRGGGSTVLLPVSEAWSPSQWGLGPPHPSTGGLGPPHLCLPPEEASAPGRGSKALEGAAGSGDTSWDGGEDRHSAESGYYMSQALRERKFSKPPFLGEPHIAKEDSWEAAIPDPPKGPGGGSVDVEDVAND